MTAAVTPESFTLVDYDAAELTAIVVRLVDAIGLPPGTAVRVEVDETTPTGRARVVSLDPIVLAIESGALEDPKRPRQLSAAGSADVIGRLLLRVRDRQDPDFGTPPADDALPLPHSVAWDTYAMGRLVRLGHRHFDNRARRLYHFRNRHGFTDAADEAFDRLWSTERLTWGEITALSDAARRSGEIVG